MNYKCNLCYNLCEAGRLRSAPCDPILIDTNNDYKEINRNNTESLQKDLPYKTNQEFTNVK